MAQGEFTKEEAQAVIEELSELFDALPKSKRFDYIGHLNDIALFLEAAKKVAPEEMQAKTQAVRWEPLPNGEYDINSDVLAIKDEYFKTDALGCNFPENMRICRKVQP